MESTTVTYSPNVYGIVFTKADSNFNFSTLKRYTRATNNTFAVVPNELNDSSFIFAGLTGQNTNSVFPWDIAIMRTDKNGNPIWAKKYDSGFDDENRGEILVNTDKSILIHGGTTQNTGSTDVIIKIRQSW